MPGDESRPVTLASLRGRPGRRMTRAQSEAANRQSNDVEDAGGSAPQMGLFLEAPEAASSAGDGAAMLPAERQTAVVVEPAAARAAGGGGDLVSRADGRGAIVSEPVLYGPEAGRRPAEVTRERSAGAIERRVWTVRGIVSDLRQRVEGGYGDVWVEGEISNCRSAASGHLYLTLKEAEAQLPVVLFRRQAQLLRFRPATGMAVLVRGRLSVYEGRGELQLIGETLEPRGAGALLLAFEQLKARLAAEGLFEAGRKRALPPFPRCVGVITSTSGAVLHDIITVVRRRHARLNLLVYPAVVQGPGCAASVMAGVRWFNEHPEKAELILIARGGGAPEDLAGFNEEGLARAIAGSALPVISAVGHETDFTIADFVADLRAPTPSSAAEVMTQSQHKIAEQLEALELGLRRAGRYRVLEARQRFARMSAEHVLRRVQQGLDRRQQRLDEAERRMERAMEKAGLRRAAKLEQLRGRLERQNVVTRLMWGGDRLARLEQRLEGAGTRMLARRTDRLARLGARLEAMSPLAVLARGYALLYNVEGTTETAGSLITSSTEIEPGQRVRARLARGSVIARVTETKP